MVTYVGFRSCLDLPPFRFPGLVPAGLLPLPLYTACLESVNLQTVTWVHMGHMGHMGAHVMGTLGGSIVYCPGFTCTSTRYKNVHFVLYVPLSSLLSPPSSLLPPFSFLPPFLHPSFLHVYLQVMPVSLLQMFDAQELEFLTAGTLEIDVADWRMHTEYRNG